jgi:hypothetical protein
VEHVAEIERRDLVLAQARASATAKMPWSPNPVAVLAGQFSKACCSSSVSVRGERGMAA